MFSATELVSEGLHATWFDARVTQRILLNCVGKDKEAKSWHKKKYGPDTSFLNDIEGHRTRLHLFTFCCHHSQHPCEDIVTILNVLLSSLPDFD